jgi:hypothetical protein
VNKSKRTKKYPIVLVVLSIFLLSCGGNTEQESATKFEEQTEVENEDSEINPAPIETLPPIIKTAEVNEFLSALISTQTFRNFNGDKVNFDSTSKVKYVLDSEGSNDELVLDLLEWGRIEKFSPADCEFFNLTQGTTRKFVDSGAIKGTLFAYEEIEFKRNNYNKAKLAVYSHVTLVFDNFEISDQIWSLKLNSHKKCLDGYTRLHSDGQIDDEANEGNTDLFISNDRNLILMFRYYDGIWDIVINIKQGGTHDSFRLVTGLNPPKDGSFEFLNELIQNVVTENARIQNIEPMIVDLTQLSTFIPEDVEFIYPDLGSKGSI